MLTKMNILTYNMQTLIVFVLLGQISYQQDSTIGVQSAQRQQFVIHYKQGQNNLPHIDFKQTQYSFNPQINQDYSIVHTHTDLYPVSSPERQQFISSHPKDAFVTKLTQKPPNPSAQPDKQQENKAQQILQKQTQEQQAKLKEEKEANIKEEKEAKLKEEKEAKLKEQRQAKLKEQKQAKLKEEKQTKLKEERQTKLKEQKAAQAAKKQTDQKKKLSPQENNKNNDLFASSKPADISKISKPDTKIPFKQHEIAKPQTITTYPFQTKNLPKKPAIPHTSTQTKQQTQKPAILPQKTKPQKQQETKKPNEQTKKEDPKKKDIIKGDENQIKKEETTKAETIKQNNLDDQVLAEYKKLSQSLSQKPQKIKNSLQFQLLGKEKGDQEDLRFLVAKVVIGLVILISIYQASCSSQSQEKKVQKGKYSPLGVSQVDTENSLDMMQKQDNR